MCGIFGFASDGIQRGEVQSILDRALSAMRHRGPDSNGSWTADSGRMTFGHVRLAIQDLTAAGHQPMLSMSGRYCITFNGEIYNHRDIRVRLERAGWSGSWRGSSDTETIVNAVEAFGVCETLKAMVGMFALAIWDHEDQVLYLARDRIGEKPLYFGEVGGRFAFSSELKPLMQMPGFAREVDEVSLAEFFRYNYVPHPRTIFKKVSKLGPGEFLKYSIGSGKTAVERYWEPADAMAEHGRSQFDESRWVAQLESTLNTVIKGQMLSDVPLGCFLSGGLDSSLVAALMQQNSASKIKTFSIGFEDKEHDEAVFAKDIARHLGTDHTERYVTEQDALDVVPLLPSIYDEPFADSSQIPTYLLSKIAREHVTVALSGDGGDEVFGGYNSYKFANDLWGTLSSVHPSVRRAAAGMLDVLPDAVIDPFFRMAGKLLPQRFRYERASEKKQKLTGALRVGSGDELHQNIMSHWRDQSPVRRAAAVGPLSAAAAFPPTFSLIERMMYTDMVTYLPGDIFVKVDRAAMACSLETRSPLVDHRLIEHLLKAPASVKIRGGSTKWALREVLYKRVPSALLDRPKKGFTVPLHAWLTGPLRPWAESLLEDLKADRIPYMDGALCIATWQMLLQGRKGEAHKMWSVLVFLAWRRHYGVA
jgi:asparagine synthase (glutamine-hydrolysing)